MSFCPPYFWKPGLSLWSGAWQLGWTGWPTSQECFCLSLFSDKITGTHHRTFFSPHNLELFVMVIVVTWVLAIWLRSDEVPSWTWQERYRLGCLPTLVQIVLNLNVGGPLFLWVQCCFSVGPPLFPASMIGISGCHWPLVCSSLLQPESVFILCPRNLLKLRASPWWLTAFSERVCSSFPVF